MKKQDYTATISANVNADKVFNRVGNTEKLNDVFTVHSNRFLIGFTINRSQCYCENETLPVATRL